MKSKLGKLNAIRIKLLLRATPLMQVRFQICQLRWPVGGVTPFPSQYPRVATGLAFNFKTLSGEGHEK